MIIHDKDNEDRKIKTRDKYINKQRYIKMYF